VTQHSAKGDDSSNNYDAVPAGRARFFILGCSRSATGYIAKLLSNSGVRCGHEKFFDIWRVMKPNPPSEFASAFPHLRGEASFLAVPYVDDLPPGSIVLHQVRHPLAVTRSHMGIRFFAEPFQPSEFLAENHPDITDFIARNAPEIFSDDDELRRSLRYWVHWNRIAQRAERRSDVSYFRYQVERIDRQLLRQIFTLLGDETPDEVLDRGLSLVPRTENHRPRDEGIAWNAMAPSAAKEAVAELAAEYGYELGSETAAWSVP
jgi:hypothetical protein